MAEQLNARRLAPVSTVVRKPATIRSVELDGEVVIVDLDNQRGYCLGGVAARVWELLQQPVTLAALVDQLLGEFAVDPDTCETDVREFLSQLQVAELISIDNC